jgi:hypothetical protein
VLPFLKIRNTSFSHWGEKKLHRRCFSAYFL